MCNHKMIILCYPISTKTLTPRLPLFKEILHFLHLRTLSASYAIFPAPEVAQQPAPG